MKSMEFLHREGFHFDLLISLYLIKIYMKVLPIISINEIDSESESYKDRKQKKRHFSLSESVSLGDVKKAKLFQDASTLRKYINNQYTEYSICSTDLVTLGKYGVGLELYFLLLKQLTIIFLIISFISIWPMYENYTGNGLGSLFQGQLYSYLSVANQPSADYDTSIDDANKLIKPLENNALNLAIADGIYTLMFLAFILQYLYCLRLKLFC